MHLGIDFDNTIVCYDALFHRVGVEGGLIPRDLPASKSEIRNYLRQIGCEDDWTVMQGYVYGARMREAKPFSGVLDCLCACHAEGIELSVISHKTRYPYLGERYDLHGAALAWLEQQGFFDPARIGLSRDRTFFELTKEAKLQRIGQCGCTHFIDDLPEFLLEPGFPPGARRILFDPNDHYPDAAQYLRVRGWATVVTALMA